MPGSTLGAIADGHPTDRTDDLLPWNFTNASRWNPHMRRSNRIPLSPRRRPRVGDEDGLSGLT